ESCAPSTRSCARAPRFPHEADARRHLARHRLLRRDALHPPRRRAHLPPVIERPKRPPVTEGSGPKKRQFERAGENRERAGSTQAFEQSLSSAGLAGAIEVLGGGTEER